MDNRTDFQEDALDNTEEMNLTSKLELERIGHEFKNLKETLFHYTSFDTLKKIAENGTWRFSSINGTNDLSEHLNLYVTYLLKQSGLFEFISEDVKENVIQNINNQNYYGYKDYFITCFSSEEDDLGQWRVRYGDFGRGVCIGIDPKFFTDKEYILKTDNLGWSKIEYNINKQNNIVSEILKEYEEPDSVWNIDNAMDLAAKLRDIALTMKHYAFNIEHEYRLIAGCVDQGFSEAEFISENMTKDYVDYDLNRRFDIYKKPLFKSILIGKDSKIKEKDIQNLFRYNGLAASEILISKSDIPYRFADELKRRKF